MVPDPIEQVLAHEEAYFNAQIEHILLYQVEREKQQQKELNKELEEASQATNLQFNSTSVPKPNTVGLNIDDDDEANDDDGKQPAKEKPTKSVGNTLRIPKMVGDLLNVADPTQASMLGYIYGRECKKALQTPEYTHIGDKEKDGVLKKYFKVLQARIRRAAASYGTPHLPFKIVYGEIDKTISGNVYVCGWCIQQILICIYWLTWSANMNLI